MNEEMPAAKAQALEALMKAADARPESQRLTPATIRAILDIAWRHQFQPEDRAAARRDIHAALQPEINRILEEKG